jgi:hypothetical protein
VRELNKAILLLLALFATMLWASAAAQRSAVTNQIRGQEHYVIRDGLRIYLWEKYRRDREGSFSNTGKVALLVHGGARSGRSIYDLQLRDYSLMDFLAQNDYDVWATFTVMVILTNQQTIGWIPILPRPTLQPWWKRRLLSVNSLSTDLTLLTRRRLISPTHEPQ